VAVLPDGEYCFSGRATNSALTDRIQCGLRSGDETMALAAHWEDIAQSAVRPRDPRRKLLLEARGSKASGEEANVLVHNISATGLLLESRAALAAGAMLEIELPLAGACRAQVVWSSGALYGCRFDAPVSSAVLSAAQLRSVTEGQAGLAGRGGREPDEPFGARLQRLRKDRGLTLAQIATGLGVSKPTVWAWEQGRARPIDERMEALAQMLGVPASELLHGAISSDLQELLARSRAQISAALGVDADKIRIMIDL